MRAVLLASGGVESLVISALFRQQYPAGFAHAIHVHYGQRPVEQEARAVRLTCEEYGITLVSPEAKFPWLDDHALVDPNTFIYGASFAEEHKLPTSKGNIVPYRNMAFLSMAVGYAGMIGADRIWTGFDYCPTALGSAKDKSPEFVAAMNQALVAAYEGQLAPPTIEAPLQGNTKIDTVRLGNRLGVKWSHSWSCYNDYALPCGVCGSCEPRRQAFEALGISEKFLSPEFIHNELA